VICSKSNLIIGLSVYSAEQATACLGCRPFFALTFCFCCQWQILVVKLI